MTFVFGISIDAILTRNFSSCHTEIVLCTPKGYSKRVSPTKLFCFKFMLLILMAMCTDNNFCWEISKFTFKLESFEPRKITKLPFTTFKGWTSWNTSWNDWKSAAYCIFDHCFSFISVMLCCNAQISAEKIFVNYRIPSVPQLCFDHKWIVRLNRIKE